ncbi:hypothetical protein [Gluconobacter morbifer]|uniref:Uncharacterized protein n=1 Tax=Gluconobacter morbifer G707 TaxID=1088869 RepID=G6XLQ6_9PROT|nr:hypothetical protein [Gluconobacter morbifer]EHH67311.1 hypothetical protein GMO_23050 [Gluconobacter morbifer G707]
MIQEKAKNEKIYSQQEMNAECEKKYKMGLEKRKEEQESEKKYCFEQNEILRKKIELFTAGLSDRFDKFSKEAMKETSSLVFSIISKFFFTSQENISCLENEFLSNIFLVIENNKNFKIKCNKEKYGIIKNILLESNNSVKFSFFEDTKGEDIEILWQDGEAYAEVEKACHQVIQKFQKINEKGQSMKKDNHDE